MTTTPTLTTRLADALAFATEAHGSSPRKGTSIPYVSHLMAVSAIALEHGGDEDDAVAALLHDVVEDTPRTVDDVEAAFGTTIAELVAACSDATEHPKPPWRARKERYVAHLGEESTSLRAARISAADKLHNARSILADYRVNGDEVWKRFNEDAQSADAQLWYYEALVEVLQRRLPGPLIDELERTVAQIRDLAAKA